MDSGKFKAFYKGKKKSPHSIKCIMTQLGNTLSVTPLNTASSVPQNLQTLLGWGGQHRFLQLLGGSECLLKEHSHLFCQEASFLLWSAVGGAGGGGNGNEREGIWNPFLSVAPSSSPQGFEPTEVLWLKHIPWWAGRHWRLRVCPRVHALVVSVPQWAGVDREAVRCTELGDLNSTL